MALPDQMIRAARLDVNLYEEVEADTNQTTNAMIVVLIAAVATAIGSAWGGGANVAALVVGGLIGPLVGWVIGTGCIYFIGTRLFGGTATWGEVMRTMGFAQAPGVLNIFRFVPGLGALIGFIAAIWGIVAAVIAIRQALDVSTGKAIVAGIIGGILGAIPTAIILAALGAATGAN